MNKESNIAYIEQLLKTNEEGMTFDQIKEEIHTLRGIELGDYKYYAQVLEDMARSGSIVRNIDGKFFLKSEKTELWDTPFYTFNQKNLVEEVEDDTRYVKNTLHETIDYDDIDDEEIDTDLSDEEIVEDDEIKEEPEVSEENIATTEVSEFDDDEIEVDDFDEDEDYYDEDEDY